MPALCARYALPAVEVVEVSTSLARRTPLLCLAVPCVTATGAAARAISSGASSLHAGWHA